MLHCQLLNRIIFVKLKLHVYFLILVIAALLEIYGLQLHSIEKESTLELIGLLLMHFISLNLLSFFLRDSLELLQLELRLDLLVLGVNQNSTISPTHKPKSPLVIPLR